MHSGDICDWSLKLSKVDPNFACFWPPNCFGWGGLEFFDQDFKIEQTTDLHMYWSCDKFWGRSAERVRRSCTEKRKKRSRTKTLNHQNGNCSGRPNNNNNNNMSVFLYVCLYRSTPRGNSCMQWRRNSNLPSLTTRQTRHPPTKRIANSVSVCLPTVSVCLFVKDWRERNDLSRVQILM